MNYALKKWLAGTFLIKMVWLGCILNSKIGWKVQT